MTHASVSRAPAGGCFALGTYYDGGQFLPIHGGAMGAAPQPSAREIESAERRAERIAQDAARSAHLGSVGQRLSVTVVVGVVLTFDGFYGPTHITIARDADGNVLVSKGAAWAKAGDVVRISGTVKSHEIRDGIRQTVVQRVRVAS